MLLGLVVVELAKVPDDVTGCGVTVLLAWLVVAVEEIVEVDVGLVVVLAALLEADSVDVVLS